MGEEAVREAVMTAIGDGIGPRGARNSDSRMTLPWMS